MKFELSGVGEPSETAARRGPSQSSPGARTLMNVVAEVLDALR
jgi:hypothetical protein